MDLTSGWHHGGVDVATRYTSHQVARGTRADAVKGSEIYLIKNVPFMRLTYQVHLLADQAATASATLVIRLPKGARLSRDLREFVRSARLVRVERALG